MATTAAAAAVHSLAELEVLCTHLYIGTDLTQRIEAEKALLELIDSPECLSKCQLLLEQGTTSYAQLLAATCLSKLVSRVSPLPVEQRIDIMKSPQMITEHFLIGNYILNYVASQPKLAPFVIQALIQVIAKITKLGWFEVQKDQLVFREIIADVKTFLQGTVEHCIIGVIILSELTQEMNLVDYSRPSAKHRKIATSFRDTSLKDILVLACSLLKEVLAKPLNLQDEGQQNLVMQVLKLVLNCLNFDFIGSSADESADDLCTVQIPTTWRTKTLDLFFNLYHSLPPLLSQLALSCLVQFASTRRSLFSSPERAKYLGNLIKGVKRILENPQGLSDPGNYHEFCRFLARLKTNYQLGELVMVKEYPEVIRLIANFTITSLQHWEFAPNSVHYLLTLWQRMVASVPFVKSTEPHLLDTYAPEITKAFITSRLESVAIVVRDNLDDPLDDTATIFQQLEQLCTVSRCEYEKTCSLLVQLFDQNAQNYQKLLHSASVGNGRLAWLVYLVGTVVGGRLTYTSTDEHDAMDGELSCRIFTEALFLSFMKRVFQLISLMDTGLPQCSNEKIELAILWFLDQFRKTYVGDQLQRTSKGWGRSLRSPHLELGEGRRLRSPVKPCRARSAASSPSSARWAGGAAYVPHQAPLESGLAPTGTQHQVPLRLKTQSQVTAHLRVPPGRSIQPYGGTERSESSSAARPPAPPPPPAGLTGPGTPAAGEWPGWICLRTDSACSTRLLPPPGGADRTRDSSTRCSPTPPSPPSGADRTRDSSGRVDRTRDSGRAGGTGRHHLCDGAMVVRLRSDVSRVPEKAWKVVKSEHFPFLGISDSDRLSDFRCRTTFYTALTRLLMVDLGTGEDEDEFENFMLPLTVSFETVLQIFNNNFKQEDVKRMLIGLARDLRGIAFALNTKTSYTMLFDWMYPYYTVTIPALCTEGCQAPRFRLIRAVEQWYGEPACTTPILKLLAELMQNRLSDREEGVTAKIEKDNYVRIASEEEQEETEGNRKGRKKREEVEWKREKTLKAFWRSNQILSLGSLSKDQIYPMKLKGISICYSALKSALCGNYVSFGVFKLYGDNHFDNVLQAFVKMLLSVSHSDLLQYRKLSQSYYPLLECLTQDHMSFITNLEPPVLLYVLTSISEGLTTLDTVVSSSCCTSLDYIVTYLFKHIAKEGKKPLRCREATQAGQRLLLFMQQNPDVLQQIPGSTQQTPHLRGLRQQEMEREALRRHLCRRLAPHILGWRQRALGVNRHGYHNLLRFVFP
ncbi:hypothetical protein QTO34_016330, partial [Cnephaeus nilssonii]